MPNAAMGSPVNRPAILASTLTRRQFLRQSLTCAAAAATTLPLSAADSSAGGHRLRGVIIGHTGQGNYGHSLELVFQGRDNITLTALADPDASGRAKAAARTGAQRTYADYRQMLEQERPQLAVVAPRCTGEHHAMALAALRAGAHVYLEKPITQTLAEADELLSAASSSGLRIAVAHQMRLAPGVLFIQQRIKAGLIGPLREMRAHGKQDRRAGGEDLIVLGVHAFDLMRFFAGEPLWCSARVSQAGHELTLADAHPATEDIGPVAGDDVFAQFAFGNGVNATFISRAQAPGFAEPYSLQLIGTKGAIKILLGLVPAIYALKQGNWTVQGQASEWRPLDGDPTSGLSAAQKSVEGANARVVDDWLAAIAASREPVCNGYAGMKALEMAMAVFAAGLSRQRVEFPLKNRNHPLRPQGS